MECAVCNVKVDDFKLQNYKGPSSGTSLPAPVPMDLSGDVYNSSFSFAPGVLESSFADFVDRAQGASTPVAGSPDRRSGKSDERAVLRIDNVPWVGVYVANCQLHN